MSKPFGTILFGLLLAAASPAVGQSAAEQAEIQQALNRGGLIYAYDQAAWHGTDDLRAKGDAALLDQVGGWIVDGPADATEIVFHDKDETDPKALYVANFRGGKLVSSRILRADENRALSAERKRLFTAKRAAVQALLRGKARPCERQPFNSVVLPPAAPGAPILAYFMTPQTDANAIPFGGHFLIEVAPDGKAGSPRRFTNSCLTMPISAPDGAKPAAVAVSHVLGPVPTEVHVFSSLAARLPVAVITKRDRTWWVDGARSIKPMPAKGRPARD